MRYTSRITMATSSSVVALFFLICLSTLLYPTNCSTNTTDYLSLHAFKNAILHHPVGALSSWNETTHFCSWEGIRCGRRHPDRVVLILLESRGLVGSLSPSIGNISFLRVINLKNNSFHGVIPDEIGRLRRLEYVEFSNNTFSGAIPTNLSQCSNLFSLNLIDNHLSGSIPLHFGFLSKMKDLGLGENNLSGHIPPSIGNLTFLVQLSLTGGSLIGEIPETLGLLRNMKWIMLSGNSLTGMIPSALLNISTIIDLDIGQNQLQGSISSSMGLTLPNLVTLILSDNRFTGPVPTSLPNISSLSTIDIGANNFSGRLPMLGTLSHLSWLSISDNLIEDHINWTASLVNCTNLEVLDISNNIISGALPDSIANLSRNLRSLLIQETQVHGNIPRGIGNLVDLTLLSLSANNLDGALPNSIAELHNLQRLSLAKNIFSGELPNSFSNMTSVNVIYMDQNELSGRIPKTLNCCTDLLLLDLSRNNFSGPIPLEIMNLSSLSILLDLSSNALTNSLPLEIHSLRHLSSLDLSDNRLSGVIPSSISGCTSLVQLYLEGNLFEGDIPQGLSALKGLQDLDLSRNQFSGLIPSFLGEFKLQRLNLSFNKFRGEVPISGVFANQSAISLEGNKDLCGGVPELKLPPCASRNFSKKNSSILLKMLIPVGIVFFLCLSIFLYKSRKPKKDLPSSSTINSAQFLRLSYADLLKATNEFSDANLVGAGRFGSVYKGILTDGQTLIAVKVLNLLVQGASKSLMKECNALRHIRHRNLLKILSVCESIDFKGNDFKSLVYEFKGNGTLEAWMYHNFESNDGNDGEVSKLDVMQRLNISIDIAHALEYLHCGTESIIVHGDLKPSNILLDDDMTACVGDFGLAKVISSIIPMHENSSSIGIKGTIGYVPPEYGTMNSISAQGDVYSYGILLLEIFTNRRPTDSLFKDHLNLRNFVSAALPDGIEEIVDPLVVGIGHDVNREKVKGLLASVLRIGVDCSKENPKDRISMTEVVNVLHKVKDCYLVN